MRKGVLLLLSMGHLVTDLNQGLVPFLTQHGKNSPASKRSEGGG